MNLTRRSFFRGLAAAAFTAVATHYTPSALTKLVAPEKTIVEQMVDALARIPNDGKKFFFVNQRTFDAVKKQIAGELPIGAVPDDMLMDGGFIALQINTANGNEPHVTPPSPFEGIPIVVRKNADVEKALREKLSRTYKHEPEVRS